MADGRAVANVPDRGEPVTPVTPPVDLSGYLDIAEVLLVTLDGHGRVSHINRRGCEILGVPDPSAVVGRSWVDEFVPRTDRPAVREVFEQILTGAVETVERFESAVLTRTGEERWLNWQNAPVRVASGRIVGIFSSGLDVTKRRQSERQHARLLKELTDLKYALDQSAIVAVTDAGGRITYVNDTFCQVAKYTREELVGRTHRLINSGHHPKAFFRDLWTTITSGRIWRGEIRNRAKDGTFYWVDTTIVPFLDASGRPYQHMAIRYEVTRRKAMEAKLLEQETLARLGEMAAVVAHEVKNPLAGISGALQVIRSRLPADSTDRAIIGDVQQRIGTLNGMVQDLLQFARPRSPVRSPIAMRALLADVAAAIVRDPTLSRTRIRVTGDRPTVSLDREQMRMALQNLLLNAAQTMDGRGRIAVTIHSDETACVVRIADRGPGLTPEVARQMFEPFFTTKHRGSGLGLPIARRIVEAHDGRLSVDRRPRGGAVVTVSLPPPLP